MPMNNAPEFFNTFKIIEKKCIIMATLNYKSHIFLLTLLPMRFFVLQTHLSFLVCSWCVVNEP